MKILINLHNATSIILGKKKNDRHNVQMFIQVCWIQALCTFCKSLYNYCRPELHTFLIDKK